MFVHLFIQVWPLGEWAVGVSALADPYTPTCWPRVRCVHLVDLLRRGGACDDRTDMCLCREPLLGRVGVVRGGGADLLLAA